MSSPNDFPPLAPTPRSMFDRIRELALYQEPALITAVRLGNFHEVRRLVNYLLVHIYAEKLERTEMFKGLLAEISLMMIRGAIEGGAPQGEAMALGFRLLSQLAGVQTDVHLTTWLENTLHRSIESMERGSSFDHPPLIAKALEYMNRNLGRNLGRDEVARHTGFSPAHFSRLLRERTGRTFSELLRQQRIDMACHLLQSTTHPLAEIASECGFCDQSHFTRVFEQLKGVTPRQWRLQHAPVPVPA